MRGTWSAERQAPAWQGTFVARSGRRVVSGRWTAYLERENVKTFQEMLQRSMEKQVAGAWDSGAVFGKWWLAAQ